jgi:SlyX protein
MSDTLERRLIDLETRMAHHERMAEELSQVVAEQARTIDGLNRRIRFLTERLTEAEAGWERSPQDERPPPHY